MRENWRETLIQIEEREENRETLTPNFKWRLQERDLGLVWFKKNGHSSLITQYTPIYWFHPFGIYFQLFITQIFLLFVGPIPKQRSETTVSLLAKP